MRIHFRREAYVYRAKFLRKEFRGTNGLHTELDSKGIHFAEWLIALDEIIAEIQGKPSIANVQYAMVNGRTCTVLDLMRLLRDVSDDNTYGRQTATGDDVRARHWLGETRLDRIQGSPYADDAHRASLDVYRERAAKEEPITRGE
jgi:hypothetical protein